MRIQIYTILTELNNNGLHSLPAQTTIRKRCLTAYWERENASDHSRFHGAHKSCKFFTCKRPDRNQDENDTMPFFYWKCKLVQICYTYERHTLLTASFTGSRVSAETMKCGGALLSGLSFDGSTTSILVIVWK